MVLNSHTQIKWFFFLLAEYLKYQYYFFKRPKNHCRSWQHTLAQVERGAQTHTHTQNTFTHTHTQAAYCLLLVTCSTSLPTATFA
jgi:hypothetical protein